MVRVWAGQDLIFFRIDMAVDDGDVDEAFVQGFHDGLTIAAGNVEMEVLIAALQLMGCLHDEADTVGFGRADADIAIQFRVVAAQFLFCMTGQGEDFFSPLFQE